MTSLALVLAGGLALGAQAPPREYAMTTYSLVFLVDGPNRNQPDAEAQALQAAHLEHLHGVLTGGQGVIVGPMADEGRLRGVLVLRTAKTDEARAIAEADPAVKAGRVAVEIHPWYAAEGIMKPVFNPADLVTYYFGMLVKGPAWTPDVSPAMKAILDGHMAHLNTTAASGKLVIAGPIDDDGVLRGILVYKVASIDEARALAEADPAVKAGRFKVELHPWMVSRGALP